jgi:conjugal transfer pilus assembly protein TrbC
MLRLVSILVITTLAGASNAEDKKAFVDYREPTAAELTAQQQFITEGLQKGEGYFGSQQFQDKLAEERLKAQIVPNTFTSNKLEVPSDVINQKWADRFNEMEAQAGKAITSSMKGKDGPIIFASLSMPSETLKALAAEANRAGGAVVFRGIKNDDFVAMRQALAGLGEGFGIDPTLFTRFNVKAVPAFLMPIEPILPCEENGCPPSRHAMVSGNVTLEGALEYIAVKSSEAGAKDLAENLLKRLREK